MRLSNAVVSILKQYETMLPKIKVHNGQLVVSESGILLNNYGNIIDHFTPVGTAAASLTTTLDKARQSILSHHHPLPDPLSGTDLNSAIKFNLKEIRAVDPILSRIHIMEVPSEVELLRKQKISLICKKYDTIAEKIDKKYGLTDKQGNTIYAEAIKAPAEYWKEHNQCFRARNKVIHQVDKRIKFRTLPLEGKRTEVLEV